MKSYLLDVYKGTLERVSFPNYENFDNPDDAYNDFITRLDCVINAITPCKTVRIKNINCTENIHKRQTTQNAVQNVN